MASAQRSLTTTASSDQSKFQTIETTEHAFSSRVFLSILDTGKADERLVSVVRALSLTIDEPDPAPTLPLDCGVFHLSAIGIGTTPYVYTSVLYGTPAFSFCWVCFDPSGTGTEDM
jgi:hypothetical protein